MYARAPASAANLGPGFDALALALSLHVEVTVEPAGAPTLVVEGEGSDDLEGGPGQLAARVAARVAGTDRLAVRVRSAIPVGRGLGSSAAVAVAAAAAAGADDPLTVAAAIDGHPENAAASVLGGLVAASMVRGRPVAAPLPLDPGLVFVVLVPTRRLATARARQALPALVPHADAAFNLGRMGLLIAGLGDRRLLVRDATDDRLHQAARTPLFPESTHLMAGLVEAGALAACWSGAGPSVLGICDAADGPAVRAAGERILAEAGVPGRSLLLTADREGLVVDATRDAPARPSAPSAPIPST
jgi:homoserine kinase